MLHYLGPWVKKKKTLTGRQVVIDSISCICCVNYIPPCIPTIPYLHLCSYVTWADGNAGTRRLIILILQQHASHGTLWLFWSVIQFQPPSVRQESGVQSRSTIGCTLHTRKLYHPSYCQSQSERICYPAIKRVVVFLRLLQLWPVPYIELYDR